MNTKQIACAAIAIVLASLACSLVQPTPVSPTSGPAPQPYFTATATTVALQPLDRRDGNSALRWLLHGLAQRDIEVFRTLTAAEFYGYANYIEGGDPVSRAQFLQDLEVRLKSSRVSCTGYEGDDQYIRVWTTGWSPAWEMTQICYDACVPLDPVYQSSAAGFFLYNLEGEWWLKVNFVNTPEKYYFSPYTLTPCSQAESFAVRGLLSGFPAGARRSTRTSRRATLKNSVLSVLSVVRTIFRTLSKTCALRSLT